MIAVVWIVAMALLGIVNGILFANNIHLGFFPTFIINAAFLGAAGLLTRNLVIAKRENLEREIKDIEGNKGALKDPCTYNNGQGTLTYTDDAYVYTSNTGIQKRFPYTSNTNVRIEKGNVVIVDKDYDAHIFRVANPKLWSVIIAKNIETLQENGGFRIEADYLSNNSAEDLPNTGISKKESFWRKRFKGIKELMLYEGSLNKQQEIINYLYSNSYISTSEKTTIENLLISGKGGSKKDGLKEYLMIPADETIFISTWTDDRIDGRENALQEMAVFQGTEKGLNKAIKKYIDAGVFFEDEKQDLLDEIIAASEETRSANYSIFSLREYKGMGRAVNAPGESHQFVLANNDGQSHKTDTTNHNKTKPAAKSATSTGPLSGGQTKAVTAKTEKTKVNNKNHPSPILPISSETSHNTVESQPECLFCRKCGSRLLPDSLFCSHCGTEVILLERRRSSEKS